MPRETPPPERSLALIADLAQATGRAHTGAALVQAVASALAGHLPVCWVEVARSQAGGDGVVAWTHGPGSTSTPRSVRKRRGPLGPYLLAPAPYALELGTLAGAAAGAPEVKQAREAGAATLVVLPLRDGDARIGHALLALGPGSPTASLAPALLDAIGRVLALALRQEEVLGRVAALSRRALAEGRQLRAELAGAVLPRDLVATSPAMRALFHEVIPLVARRDTTVLLRGETGTGKEVVARRIHALSPRASRPFVAANCGALPEGIAESTLFGHEKGAFTGAGERHRGLFERADGGTLFLDEVGELSPGAQVKLLRALQEEVIERVGGEVAVRVDVRVIAATSRPLEAMVEAGTFRPDLYYRLAVFPIAIPPLRERPGDLEGLVQAILTKLAARFDRPAPAVSPSVIARLRAHRWPGNVRELENVLERAMVLSTDDALVLPPGFEGPAAAPRSPARKVETLREAMRRCVENALAASGGKIYGPDGAAAALGLKPTTLQSTMKRLGVRRDR